VLPTKRTRQFVAIDRGFLHGGWLSCSGLPRPERAHPVGVASPPPWTTSLPWNSHRRHRNETQRLPFDDRIRGDKTTAHDRMTIELGRAIGPTCISPR
jgi:hypothetical protein